MQPLLWARIASAGPPSSLLTLLECFDSGLQAADPAWGKMGTQSGPPAQGWARGDVEWDSQSMQVAGKPAAGSAGPSAAAEEKERRKRRRFVNPDSCQVEGCAAPLELAYHRVSSAAEQAEAPTNPCRAASSPPPAPCRPLCRSTTCVQRPLKGGRGQGACQQRRAGAAARRCACAPLACQPPLASLPCCAADLWRALQGAVRGHRWAEPALLPEVRPVPGAGSGCAPD